MIESKDVTDYFNDPESLTNGNKGIWLSTSVKTDRKEQLYWLILDVESQEHDNIAENIECAQHFLMFLEMKGLTQGLKIILTGRGFRFVFPYLVPPELSKAFIAFVNDNKRFPYIDPGLLSPVPHRIFAYRGNVRQDSSRPDVHTQFINAEDCYDLDEKFYKYLVSEKIDGRLFLSGLKTILPTSFFPVAWEVFLEDYNRQVRLKNAIFIPFFLPSRTVFNVREYLDSEKISYAESVRADTLYYILDNCPICQRKNKAWINAKGFLFCFHSSCDAGQFTDSGARKGIAPSIWTHGKVEDEPEIIEEKQFISIEEARQRIENAILNDSEDLIIRMTPGAGKTVTTLKSLAKSQLQKILFSAPTKILAEQVLKQAKIEGLKAFLLEGRNPGNCAKFRKVEQAISMGFSPKLTVCPGCKSRKICKYLRQFEDIQHKDGLFITTHAQGIILDLAGEDFDIVIFDESATNNLFEKKELNLKDIEQFRNLCPEFFDRMLQTLKEQLEVLKSEKNAYYRHARLYAGKIPDTQFLQKEKEPLFRAMDIGESDPLISELAEKLELWEQWDNETPFGWQQRLMKHSIFLHSLRWLLSAVNSDRHSDVTAYVKISVRKNPYEFITFRKYQLSYAKRIILLDATGNKAEADNLFGRDFKEIKAFIETKARKIRIKKAFGKIKAYNAEDTDIRELLEKAVRYIKEPEISKVLICTHKVIEERVKDIAKSIFNDFQVIHFFGESRGVNLYEKYNVFIALGTPCVNADELADIGNSIFQKKQDFAKWLQHINQSELFQACHRIRPALYENKTVIIIGRHYPYELGSPDIIEDVSRGIKSGRETTEEAYDRCKNFVKRYGWLSRAMSYHLGISCKAEKDAVDVFQWFKKWIKENISNNFVKELQGFIPDEAILFGGDGTYWDDILEKLQSDFPELPELESNHGTAPNWVKGIGDITSVYEFFKMLGLEDKFCKDKWREKLQNQAKP